MVDIHSHILPGLDDGSKSLEESVAMLRIAAEEGVTDIVASPHADNEYRYDPERVAALIAELESAAADIPIRIHSACDFHVQFDNIEDALAHPTRYTIAHRNYLLVELSDLVIFNNTGELFSRLEHAGMTLIVTHPERNPLLRQRLELVAEWVAHGRLMQVTAQSLTGRWGKQALDFSRLMLDRGLVHFIASDAHDTERRPPRLAEARAWIAAHHSEALAELLSETHPRAAVDGRPIDLSAFPPRAGRAERPGLLARLFGRN